MAITAKHLVLVDLNDLRKANKELIDQVLESIKPKDEERYITRKQAAVFLSVSLSTIDHWSRIGKIKKEDLKGSVRFDKEDLVKLVKEV